MDLPERQGDLNTLLKVDMKKSTFEFSVTEGNEEGKSKMEVSKAHETKTQVVLQGGRSWVMGRNMAQLVIDQRTSLRKLGSKVVKRRLVWKSGVGVIKKLKVFQRQ